MSTFPDGLGTTTFDDLWYPRWRRAPLRGSGRLGHPRLAFPLGPALIAAIVLFTLGTGAVAALAVLAEAIGRSLS